MVMITYKVSFSTASEILVEASTFKIESDSYIFYKNTSQAVAAFKRSSVLSVTPYEKSDTEKDDESYKQYELSSNFKGETLRSTMIAMLREISGPKNNGLQIFTEAGDPQYVEPNTFKIDHSRYTATTTMMNYNTLKCTLQNNLELIDCNFSMSEIRIKATDILNYISKLVYLNNQYGNNLIVYIQDLDFYSEDGIDCYTLHYFLGYVDTEFKIINETSEPIFNIRSGIAQDTGLLIYYSTLKKDHPIVQIML